MTPSKQRHNPTFWTLPISACAACPVGISESSLHPGNQECLTEERREVKQPLDFSFSCDLLLRSFLCARGSCRMHQWTKDGCTLSLLLAPRFSPTPPTPPQTWTPTCMEMAVSQSTCPSQRQILVLIWPIFSRQRGHHSLFLGTLPLCFLDTTSLSVSPGWLASHSYSLGRRFLLCQTSKGSFCSSSPSALLLWFRSQSTGLRPHVHTGHLPFLLSPS